MPYKNKERRREYQKEYYQKNKEKVKVRGKEYYQKNKSKIKEKRKKHNQRPEVKKRRREYLRTYNQRQEIKVRRNEYYKKYNQKPEFKKMRKKNKQKPECQKRRREYEREYCKIPYINIKRRLKFCVRSAINRYTKNGKIMNTKLYGINIKAIIKQLKPFPKDLSQYHIDHIKPLCSFNFINGDGTTNLREIKIAFAPKNHQWLTVQENLSKGRREIPIMK